MHGYYWRPVTTRRQVQEIQALCRAEAEVSPHRVKTEVGFRFAQEGDLIVRTSSCESKPKPKSTPLPPTDYWKEKLTGNRNKDPTKFKRADFPTLG